MTAEENKIDQTNDTGKELKLNEAFEKLDAIAEKLENRDTTLEESFALYQQGIELLKYCGSRLDTVEKKILELNEDGTYREFPG